MFHWNYLISECSFIQKIYRNINNNKYNNRCNNKYYFVTHWITSY